MHERKIRLYSYALRKNILLHFVLVTLALVTLALVTLKPMLVSLKVEKHQFQKASQGQVAAGQCYASGLSDLRFTRQQLCFIRPHSNSILHDTVLTWLLTVHC